jgi:hypothetical protein
MCVCMRERESHKCTKETTPRLKKRHTHTYIPHTHIPLHYIPFSPVNSAWRVLVVTRTDHKQTHTHTHTHECVSLCLTFSHITLHYTTLHYTTLYYTTIHYTTLHFTTLHHTAYLSLQCTARGSSQQSWGRRRRTGLQCSVYSV